MPLGSTVHDMATVSGSAGTPTGNVTFYWFTNSSCEGTGASAGTVALNTSGVADPSSSEGPLAAGTNYAFHAVYSGDTKYDGKTSACEPLTVNKAQLAITTDIHDVDHKVVTSVGLGAIVTTPPM